MEKKLSKRHFRSDLLELFIILSFIFMIITIYVPKAIWEEEADKKGDITKKAEHRMPEFLKTHPNHKKRQDNFEKWIPEVKEKYSSYILEEWNISD